MEAKYHISEQDYVNSVRLFGKLSQIKIYLVGFIVLMIVATFGPSIFRGGAIGGLAGGIIIFFYGCFCNSSVFARRYYRQSKVMQEEVTLIFDEYGLHYISSSVDFKIAWGDIFKWRQNENSILIYLMPKLYFIIPRSLPSTHFDMALLIERLNTNVGISE